MHRVGFDVISEAGGLATAPKILDELGHLLDSRLMKHHHGHEIALFHIRPVVEVSLLRERKGSHCVARQITNPPSR